MLFTKISTIKIIYFSIFLIITLILPIFGTIFLKKKRKDSSIKYLFLGTLIYFIFVNILESIFNAIVFKNVSNTESYIFILVTSIIASIFETFGIFFGIKIFMKNDDIKSPNILMFIAGYAFFELIFIFGTTMINNIAYSFLFNSDNIEHLLENNNIGIENLNIINLSLENVTLKDLLLSFQERIVSILLQAIFIYLIWISIKTNNTIYILIPFCMHIFSDFCLVSVFKINKTILLLGTEVLICSIYIFITIQISKKIKYKV